MKTQGKMNPKKDEGLMADVHAELLGYTERTSLHGINSMFQQSYHRYRK